MFTLIYSTLVETFIDENWVEKVDCGAFDNSNPKVVAMGPKDATIIVPASAA